MLISTVVVSKNFKKYLVIALLFIVSICLYACGEDDFDKYGLYDSITSSCKIQSKFTETSCFLTDGAGYATVSSYTDGDTTNFHLVTGQNIIIRYYGVDTPESTGSIEKWGKAASQLVKDRLSAATSIVLEATSTPAVHDSYGTRYLGYVWYKTDSMNDYQLLNLELVENGLSKNKCINTSDYIYYSYFKKAEDFAKNNKLRLFGSYEDPLFSTEAEKITLADFYANTDAYYNSDADAGSKVRIQMYIVDVIISSTGTYTYVGQQVVDGTTYNLNIYCGYSSASIVSSNYITIGNLYSMTGNIAKHNNEWQIAGLKYVAMKTGGDFVSQLQKNYYCTFDSAKTFNITYGTSLFTDATITSATVDGTKLSIKATAKNVNNLGLGDSEEFTFTCTVEAGFDASNLTGQTFSTTGLQVEKNSKVISVEYSKLNFK